MMQDYRQRLPRGRDNRPGADLRRRGQLPPGEVQKKMIHEVVGHKGLRAIIPENQLNPFLDAVYRQHFQEEDFKHVAKMYKTGEDITTVDPDSGEDITDYSIHNPEAQRYTAEEYLAGIVENDRAQKPAWWKQMLADIRTYLRKVMPNLRFSDNDIESAIARSARAMRRGRVRKVIGIGESEVITDRNGQQQTTTDGTRFALDQEGNYFPAPDEWGTAFTDHSGKGMEAIQFLLDQKTGFVPAAFHRDDVGDIDIVYGKIGTGIEDQGGYGIAHINKRHPRTDWGKVAQVIQNGTLFPQSKDSVLIAEGKGKVAVKLDWKGQERKWVVSAMGNDLTSTADSLLASNPAEAAKQGIAPKGMGTIADLWPDVKPESKENTKLTDAHGKTPTQIKSDTDNIGTYDPDNPDIRYSLAEYPESDQHDIVAMLRPYTGRYVNHTAEEYAEYLAGKGVDIPVKDAWAFALEACRKNRDDSRKRNEKRRDEWIYQNNNLWRECVDFCGGTEFKIKPSVSNIFQNSAQFYAYFALYRAKYVHKTGLGRP